MAQPLFDVIGRSPDVFLFRRAGRADILIVVALVVFGCPVALWACQALVGLASQSARRILHLAVVAGLLLLIVIQVAKKLTAVRGVPLLLVALTGGLIATAVYARSSVVWLWLRYATPAPLVFALLFVTVSPAGKLVLPGGQDTGRARAVVPADARAPVVMVFFDEFPMMSLLDSRGRIDRRLYPTSPASPRTRPGTATPPASAHSPRMRCRQCSPAGTRPSPLLLPTPSIPTTCSRCWPTPTRSGHGRP